MKPKLIQIYECFCDETRLRILNLLSATPLCVSHLQKVLQITQVKVSKHLTYMKDREMVTATRYENRMLYSLKKESSLELQTNLKCLQDCSKEYPIFKQDLLRLKKILHDVKMVKKNLVKHNHKVIYAHS